MFSLLFRIILCAMWNLENDDDATRNGWHRMWKWLLVAHCSATTQCTYSVNCNKEILAPNIYNYVIYYYVEATNQICSTSTIYTHTHPHTTRAKTDWSGYTIACNLLKPDVLICCGEKKNKEEKESNYFASVVVLRRAVPFLSFRILFFLTDHCNIIMDNKTFWCHHRLLLCNIRTFWIVKEKRHFLSL